jgi:cell division protein FtsB
MSLQNSITSTTIALAIIGLVIGGGVGYFYVSGSLQPKINELETNLQMLENTNNELKDEVSDISSELVEAEEQLALIESEVSSLKENIESITSEKEELETDLEELENENTEHIHEIGELSSRLGERIDWKTFYDYELSFEHPPKIEFTKIVHNKSYGLLLGFESDGETYVSVGWSKNETKPELQQHLEIALEQLGEQGLNIQTQFMVESSVNGHSSPQVYFTVNEKDVAIHGLIGVWYCEETEREFYLIVYKSNAEVFKDYYRIVDSFLCHFESGHT